MRWLPVLALLAACSGVLPPPTPEPPGPPPEPTGTLCAQSCARYVQLGCDTEGLGQAQCTDACERYEEQASLAPALSWHPDCQRGAATCNAWDECRAR